MYQCNERRQISFSFGGRRGAPAPQMPAFTASRGETKAGNCCSQQCNHSASRWRPLNGYLGLRLVLPQVVAGMPAAASRADVEGGMCWFFFPSCEDFTTSGSSGRFLFWFYLVLFLFSNVVKLSFYYSLLYYFTTSSCSIVAFILIYCCLCVNFFFLLFTQLNLQNPTPAPPLPLLKWLIGLALR